MDVPIVRKRETFAVVALVEFRTAPERLIPQDPLISGRDVYVGFLSGDVAVHQHELFQPTYVIGVRMSDQYVVDIQHCKTGIAKRAVTGSTTVYQEMIFTFDDQQVGLVVAFRKRTPASKKTDPQLTVVFQSNRPV
jgi:hypothetical protein